MELETTSMPMWPNITGIEDDDECSVFTNATDATTGNCSSVNGSDIAPCRHPEYYSFNYAVVGTLFQTIIFVIGVLGNLLVCAVVYRTRSMHSTTNCYLVRPPLSLIVQIK
jgi:hypothetical protein